MDCTVLAPTIPHRSGSSLHTRFCHLFKAEIVHMFLIFNSNSYYVSFLFVEKELLGKL